MSPSVYHLIPGVVARDQAQVVYAEVTTPAPQAFTDTLFVLIRDWSSTLPIAIAPGWPACHGNTLPLAGDAVLLITDSRGFRRCVWVDGQMTFSTQTSQTYYLGLAASDVGGHTKMTSLPIFPKSTLSLTGVTNGQTVLDYVTEPGVPGVTFLPAGQFECHIHALQAAGDPTVQLYAEFWEYDPVGATHVAMIGQTQVSAPLTGIETEYRLFFTNPSVYAFVSNQSRISVHLRAVGTGVTSVSCFVGGTADSHAIVPCNAPPATPPTFVATTKTTDVTSSDVYWTGETSPTLLGGMQYDPFKNGPRVPIDGWYQLDFNFRADMGATGGTLITAVFEVWTSARNLAANSRFVWLASTSAVNVVGQIDISGLIYLTAGQYLFPHFQGTATTVWYGTVSWPYSQYSLRWVSRAT